MHGVVY